MTTIECLAAGILLALFWVFVAASLVWVSRDARRRGRSGLLVGLLVLVFYPVSLLVWLALRPEPRDARLTTDRTQL